MIWGFIWLVILGFAIFTEKDEDAKKFAWFLVVGMPAIAVIFAILS